MECQAVERQVPQVAAICGSDRPSQRPAPCPHVLTPEGMGYTPHHGCARPTRHGRAPTNIPSEKVAEALQLMRAGIRLQRAKLQKQHPDESEEQIDQRLRDWLQRDD